MRKLSHLDRSRGLSAAAAVLTEVLGSLDLLDEGIRVLEVREKGERSAAERTAVAVRGDTLTADVKAGGEAAHLGDGGANPSTADLPDTVLIVEDSTNRVGDDAVESVVAEEGVKEVRGVVPLDVVLENLDVGRLVDGVGLAEHEGARLEDPEDLEPDFVLLGDLGSVENAHAVLLHGVNHGTLRGVRGGVSHF